MAIMITNDACNAMNVVLKHIILRLLRKSDVWERELSIRNRVHKDWVGTLSSQMGENKISERCVNITLA